MPTYDFVCSNGHVTEELHTASKAPEYIDCPKCWLVARRQLGAGSTPIFKGSGFYSTDYKAQKPPEPPA